MIETLPDDVPGFWEQCAAAFEARRVVAPRVVLHGGYGKNNMGDDAILHVLLERVRRHLPSARITVVCHGPHTVGDWYPDVHACHFKSFAALGAILRSHLYIIGGGGIVNRINTYSGYRTLRILDMKGKFQFLAALGAGLFGARTHFYAIGATSFPDPLVTRLVRLALSRADLVSVRDPLTAANLRKIGVKRDLVLVKDPALSLEPDRGEAARAILAEKGFSPKGERARPLVGLNLRYVGDPRIDNERTVSEAAKLVRRLIDVHNAQVFFLSISQHPSKHLEDDLDFGRRVRALVGPTADFQVLDRYPRPTEMMALIGEMDALILSRLHACILAWKMGTPFLTISYDHKVTEFVKLVEREGMMIPLEDFTAEGLRTPLGKLLRTQGERYS